MANGGTGPDALPNDTHMPRGFRPMTATPDRWSCQRLVIDHVAEFVTADLLHAIDEVLFVVIDDVIAAIGQRQLALLFRADGADHMRAHGLGPHWQASRPMPPAAAWISTR